jgi:hypothetical protein
MAKEFKVQTLILGGVKYYGNTIYTTTNPSGYISTGAADLRYLGTSNTGVFYPRSNPSGFITEVVPNNFSVLGQTNLGPRVINDTPNQSILLVGGAISVESVGTNYDNASPSHGIEFYRNWLGTTTGKEGGIFAFSAPNWGGGLVLKYKSNDSNPTGPLSQGIVLQSDSNVYIGNNVVQSAEKLRVDGVVRADLGFFSGTTNIANLFYSVDNPDGYVNSSYVSTVSGDISSRLEATGNYLYTLIIENTGGGGGLTTGTADTRYLRLINTGLFVGVDQTGRFYPSNNPNSYAPSGYVNSTSGVISNRLIATGDYLYNLILSSLGGGGISTGDADARYLRLINTGAFVGINQTGQFYPTSNPDGFINNAGGDTRYLQLTNTGSFVNVNQTGLFYAASNPSNFISTVGGDVRYLQLTNTGIFVGINQTGNFVGRGETGLFYAATNPNGYINTSGGDTRYLQLTNTGLFVGTNQTGQFYPVTNPSNYLTSSATGILVGKNETGQFYAANNPNNYISTGNGDIRYALAANTGSFITTAQTGNFVPRSETGRFNEDSKSISVFSPLNTDVITLFYTTGVLSLQRITSTLVGSMGAAVAASINFSSDRSAGGNEVIGGGFNTNSQTTGNHFVSLTSGTVPANSFVWLKITGITNTVSEFHTSIFYRSI